MNSRSLEDLHDLREMQRQLPRPNVLVDWKQSQSNRRLAVPHPLRAVTLLLRVFAPAAGWQFIGTCHNLVSSLADGGYRADAADGSLLARVARGARMLHEPGSPSPFASLSFSHVHAYCDALKPLREYKLLEDKLNLFAERMPDDVEAGRHAWLELGKSHGNPVTGVKDPAQWKGYDQDVVEQLLVGLGWRITGKHVGTDTNSLVVTSPADEGATFVFTAHANKKMDGEILGESAPSADRKQLSDGDLICPDHFSAANLERAAEHRAGQPGFTVLGFTVPHGDVNHIHAKYLEKHPKLLLHKTPCEYNGVKVLEVFAYYKGEKDDSDADRGTVLRFVEAPKAHGDMHVLPGVERVKASFAANSHPAYCDHWVSNVVSRTGFIDTLVDTLGFSTKVDFNAGVVAAGEAQIESTVVGNDPQLTLSDEQMALRSQAQVYLPINNALSEVGHVHLYLQEIGQGIQHIASRVPDLPAMIQHANDMRKVTGAGLSFLNIPRSYYGSLKKDGMMKDMHLDAATAQQYITALQQADIVSLADTVNLDVTRQQIVAALPSTAASEVVDYVLRARYSNLYSLLQDAADEETYLAIVRNQILVDIQGGDLLMQIFTAPVMQRVAGQEAPFFEFIQRVCSSAGSDPSSGKSVSVKPGCGGFGIRNFLTLFLSIEVSKASKQRADAALAGNQEAATYYQNMVDAFTEQLDESNSVLTLISDAMTEEGAALSRGDSEAAARYKLEKEKGNEELMAISTKYKNIMKELRKDASELIRT